jgi:hypothetical protein
LRPALIHDHTGDEHAHPQPTLLDDRFDHLPSQRTIGGDDLPDVA